MEVSHQKCPHCNHNGCFSYNTDKKVWNCFSCGYSNGNNCGKPYFERNDTSVIEEEGYQLEPYYRDYRGLTSATIEKCGAYFTKTPDGKETIVYPYKNATKYRNTAAKDFRAQGELDSFWGQDSYNGGGGTITITEGENDRMSVIQMMGDYPCVSVPGATPSKDFWRNAQDYLSGFEKIVLSVDNDDPGNKLADKFYRMFPGKVYRVPHTKFKDAHEFLENGALKEYRQAWFNAQKMKPETILSTAEDFNKLYDTTPDYHYFKTGIKGLDEKMLGIHKGCYTIIVAPTGVGKTEFMRYLEYQALSTTDYKIAICHLEETPLRSLLGLVSYHLKDNLTRKDLITEKNREEDVRKAFEEMAVDERLYQFQLRTDQGPDDLIEQIRFLVTAMGVDYIFLEPIQDVVTGVVNDKESRLSDLANTLSRLAPEINVGIVAIAHANDEGEIKYCRTIGQKAAFEILLTRDQMSEDEEERNRTKVSVGKKNRVGGGSGPAGVMEFDLTTYTLKPDTGPVEPKGISHGDF